MGRYLAVRLYSMGITLAGLTVLVFLMLRLVPGTVVEQMIGADAVVSKEMVEQLKRFFGLDQPWYTQYLAWIGRLAHGDFGTFCLSLAARRGAVAFAASRVGNETWRLAGSGTARAARPGRNTDSVSPTYTPSTSAADLRGTGMRPALGGGCGGCDGP
jgi:ABC-type dipeptide/oligopeptide/nickel transport system permease component